MSATQLQLHGFQVGQAGTYVLLEDVIGVAREYSNSLEDPAAAIAVLAFTMWLNGGEEQEEYEDEKRGAMDPNPPTSSPLTGGAPGAAVYRIELYPIEENGKQRWYARTVDEQGDILLPVAESYNYEEVYNVAHDRYPDVPIQQLNGPMDDSVWMEQQERNAYPTAAPLRERVSPRRMFGR